MTQQSGMAPNTARSIKTKFGGFKADVEERHAHFEARELGTENLGWQISEIRAGTPIRRKPNLESQ